MSVITIRKDIHLKGIEQVSSNVENTEVRETPGIQMMAGAKAFSKKPETVDWNAEQF